MCSSANSRRSIYDMEYNNCKMCNHNLHVCGKKINSALTKDSIDDENLFRYIAKCCPNFARVTDAVGKTALHMVSSTGRSQIAEWLINHGALIDFKDQESGDTALHRAISYGCIDCAVVLIRYGADIEIISKDYLNPMQAICKLSHHVENSLTFFTKTGQHMFASDCGRYYRPRNVIFARAFPEKQRYIDATDNELLVWGANKNYNLGTEKEKDLAYPQFVEYFKKHNIVIKLMAISSYHSLFVDEQNQLYSVGHGGGGRLGNDSQNILTVPTKIEHIDGKDYNAVLISCAKNHSLLLTIKNLYSCGENNHCQLGYETENNKSTEFKMVPITESKSIFKIIAKEKYSLAATQKLIYVWGTNNGQFGSNYADVKQSSKPLPIQAQYGKHSYNISLVSASNTAIACVIDEEIAMPKVLLFQNHGTHLVKFPFFDRFISKIHLSENQEILEMLLNVEDRIYIWNDYNCETYDCVVKMRNISFDEILYGNGKILLISDGELYQGTVEKIPFTSDPTIFRERGLRSFKLFSSQTPKISTTHVYNIELKNVLHVDRVKDIFCDNDFESFGLLQDKPTKYYTVPDEKLIDQNFSFLLNDSSEFNEICDVVIHVNTKEYHCHKYIIFLKSPGLKDVINESNDKKNIYLNYKYLTSKMFELILKHIYENYVLSEQDFVDISNSLNSIDHSDYMIEKNEINMECFDFLYLLDPKHISVHAFLIFLDYTVKFELKNLIQHIRNFPILLLIDKENAKIPYQEHEEMSVTLYPELYDITIICEDNLKMGAHKCILVSRSEYFKTMLNKCWSVKNVIKLETVQYEYMLEIIDFLYTQNVKKFRDKNYHETFLYKLIVICDLFLINDLRNVCEIILAEKISIKKCGDLLQFAHTYNCSLLEKCCLDFICQNLRRILIYKSLEVCTYDVFKKINAYYRKLFNIPVLKPYSNAINDLELLKFVKNFDIDFCNKSKEIKRKSKIRNLNKFEQSKKDCEKQAINSISKLLLIDEEIKKLSISSDIDNNDKNNSMGIKENNEKDQLVTEKWKKINDKRTNKKHPKTNALECAIKCNYILKNEKQEMLNNDLNNTNDVFTILNSKDKIDKNESVVMNKNRVHSYNFGDLFACNKIEKKTSQKQRKLESKLTDDSNLKMLKSNATQISKYNNDNYIYNNNQWNLSSPNDVKIMSFADIIKSQKNSENLQFKILPKCNDDSKFSSSKLSTVLSSAPKSCTGAIPKIKKKTNSETSSDNNNRQQNNNNTLEFSKILEDEKRQKEYCEQLKNKSFALTQVEDTAINELEKFYNSNNVYDEDIKIKLKTMPITRNFNIWQYNRK